MRMSLLGVAYTALLVVLWYLSLARCLASLHASAPGVPLIADSTESVAPTAPPTERTAVPTKRVAAPQRPAVPPLPANATADDLVLQGVLAKLEAVNPERAWPSLVFLVQLNFAFIEFAYNFHFHASRTVPPSTERLLFVALDDDTHAALQSRGMLSYRAPGNFSGAQIEFRAKGWNTIMYNKFTMIRRLHGFGYDVLLLDVDALLLRNPVNYLVDLPRCDAYLTAEQVNNSQLLGVTETRWAGTYDHKKSYTLINLNAGVMLWRNSPAARFALADFNRDKYRRRVGDEQMELNEWFASAERREERKQREEARKRESKTPPLRIALDYTAMRTQCARFAGMDVMVLPPCLFSTRPQAFIGRLADLASTTPYVVHFNWGFGTDNKRGGIESGGMWMRSSGPLQVAANAKYNVSGFPPWAEAFVGNVLEAFHAPARSSSSA